MTPINNTRKRAGVDKPYRSSLALDALQRLLRSKVAIAGLIIMGIFVFTAILAPLLTPYDPIVQALTLRRQPPSWAHPLGMDDLGRDILSRIIFGTRKSLQVGVLSVSLAIVVGMLIGAVAGYAGGLG